MPTITAETATTSSCSRSIRAELSERAPQWASQVCRATETTLELDRNLPERASHGRAVLRGAADRFGGKWRHDVHEWN
jgi:hypothetical protein